MWCSSIRVKVCNYIIIICTVVTVLLIKNILNIDFYRARESLGHRNISVYDSGNNPGDVYWNKVANQVKK